LCPPDNCQHPLITAEGYSWVNFNGTSVLGILGRATEAEEASSPAAANALLGTSPGKIKPDDDDNITDAPPATRFIKSLFESNPDNESRLNASSSPLLPPPSSEEQKNTFPRPLREEEGLEVVEIIEIEEEESENMLLLLLLLLFLFFFVFFFVFFFSQPVICAFVLLYVVGQMCAKNLRRKEKLTLPHKKSFSLTHHKQKHHHRKRQHVIIIMGLSTIIKKVKLNSIILYKA
tara:strand:- start:6763 stop:7461 length:699 start_codon:yes stop_codon:yes gene_type:complete